MLKLILIFLATVFLACGGSGGSNPAAAGNDSGNENTDNSSSNPLVADWTVSEVTVDNMTLGNPDASGSVAISSGTISVSIDVLGAPILREYGNYTNTTTDITVLVESTGEIKTWSFTVDETTLKLAGTRSADGENLSLRITAYK